ncbi:sulfite exporter TauE/SafE family protein [Candidatus Gracilibacteria bacterium]|nr:sulfite exporter TauE/SafE family protein [Candidatus Gracilibacteria bacterium]MCF7898833.1 sulfite exporter TauE/SafE family protein [Candidatus Paceibacterota bacterium]
MKKYTLHVSGTHCASCKISIEDVLKEQDFIVSADVDIKNEQIEVETNIDYESEELAKKLTEIIKPKRYVFSVEKIVETKEGNSDMLKAIPIGVTFLVLFIVLQKSGVLDFGIGGGVTPTTAVLIGLIASVSSCLAVVGGLVFSLSAKIAQDDKKNKKPIMLFHIGRLVGFAFLGGVLGLLGEKIGISFIFSSILGIIASIIMLTLGLNLVGVFKKSKFTLPSGIFSFFRKIEHETFTPLFIGLGTFFLPCGFTQAMQFSALSSGSFATGSMIMFSFALGTLPVLALLSFGSASFANSKYASVFFKSAGVVVIGLGVFALLAGLAGLGIIDPLFNI